MQHSSPETARKYHYWRGFRAAMILAAVPILALTIACNVALAALMQGF